MRKATLRRILAFGLALGVLLAVFSLYLQPAFMVSLSQQAWACF